MGDPIRAINFFQRAYQVDTLYVSAYREAYNLYLRQGNYKPMIDVLTFATEHGNDTWEINSNLGTAYLGDNDPGRAIQYFERALLLNRRSYKTNIQLGLAYQTIKDYQKAREYFNSAIGLDPIRQEAVNYLQRLNEEQRSDR
jgi:tetratricopeptide (TPR) repeat protein